MTFGTKIDNRTVATQQYDVWLYDGSYQPVAGTDAVGMSYRKDWYGSDYPSTPPASIFQRYFEKIPFDGNTAMPSPPKVSYRERWAERHSPRRKTQVDHPYDMSIDMWSNSMFTYIQTNSPIPNDKYFSVRGYRKNLGDGYNIDYLTRWTNNDTLGLVGKLREQIAGSDFDMGIFLAEGKEALSLIGNTAIRIRKSLQAAKKGDFVEVAKLLGTAAPRGKARIDPKGTNAGKAIADKWLELQYGWLPLIKDVQGGAEALAKHLNDPYVKTYKVRRKKPMKPDYIHPWVGAGGAYTLDASSRAQLIARVTEVNVPGLYGLIDPAAIAWELLPYSFVADWFIPIGNYLAARGLSSSVSGTFVTTVTSREFFTCSGFGGLPGTWELLVSPNYRSMKITCTRSVSQSLQFPSPNMKPLSKVASWQHCANAVALLTSKFASSR